MAITVGGVTRGRRRSRGGGTAFGGGPSYSRERDAAADPSVRSRLTVSRTGEVLRSEQVTPSTTTRVSVSAPAPQAARARAPPTFAAEQKPLITGSDYVYTDPQGRSIGVSAALADKIRGDQYAERQRLSAAASVPVGTRMPTALGREVQRRAAPPTFIAVGGLGSLVPGVGEAQRTGPQLPPDLRGFTQTVAARRSRADSLRLGRATPAVRGAKRRAVSAGQGVFVGSTRPIRLAGEARAAVLESQGRPFAAGVVRRASDIESLSREAAAFGLGGLVVGRTVPGILAGSPRLSSAVTRGTLGLTRLGSRLGGVGLAAPVAAGLVTRYPGQVGEAVPSLLVSGAAFSGGLRSTGVGRVTPVGDVATRAAVVQSRSGSFIVRGTQQQSFIRRGFFGDSSFTRVRPFGASIRAAPGVSQVRYGKELTVLPSGFGLVSAAPRSFAGFVKPDRVGSRGLFAEGFPRSQGGARLATETLTGLGRPRGRGYFEAATGRTALTRGFTREAGAFQQAAGFTAPPGRLRAGLLTGRGRFIGLQPAQTATGFGPGSFVKPRLRAPRSAPRGRGFVSPTEFSPSVLRPVRGRAPSFGVGFALGGAQRTGSVLGGAQLASPRSLLGTRGFLRPGTISRGRLAQGFIEGPGTITRTGTGTALTPATGQSTISRLGLITAPGLFPGLGGLGGSGVPPPAGGLLGGPLPLFGIPGGRRSRGGGTPRSFTYSPSLSGFFVPASTAPGRTATGLEVRPFIRRRRAKRSKK